MMQISGKKVYLACGHTDMRKSINGLAALVEAGFKLSPFQAGLFVFCNRSRDRIKILEWDGDGFWLYFKRLESGRFCWPGLHTRAVREVNDQGGLPARAGSGASGREEIGEDPVMRLTGEELNLLLAGPRIAQKLKRKEVKTGPTV